MESSDALPDRAERQTRIPQAGTSSAAQCLLLANLAVEEPMRAALPLLVALAACAGPREPAPVAPSPRPTPTTATPRPHPDHRDSANTLSPGASEPTPASAPTAADPLAAEAAAVVDRQNAAYNRHDLEAFLATYADSVAVQRLGDTVSVTGKAKLRESTSAWFAEAPGARTEVIERMVLGPFVVDRQRVSGVAGSPPLDAIGIYEVREGLIRRVWSVPPPPTPH